MAAIGEARSGAAGSPTESARPRTVDDRPRSTVPRPSSLAEHPAWKRSGGLALFDDHLVAHDHARETLGPLDVPSVAGRRAAQQRFFSSLDRLRIEDPEVSGQPLPDQTAIGQAHHAGREEAQPLDC